MIIIPPGQTIKVQIEDASFWITTLTAQQRQEILTFKKNEAGETVSDTYQMAKTALKYALKKAEGLYLPGGAEFELEFNDGQLCDEHCEMLIDASAVVHTLALKLTQGIAPQTGPGVKVTYESKSKKKTRRA